MAVKRLGQESGREKVQLSARMLPLAEKHYALARQIFGPADNQRIAPSAADIVSAEGVMSGSLLGLFGGAAQQQPYHLIAGILDVDPPPPSAASGPLITLLQTMMNTPFYLGAWPTPGFLQIFGLGRQQGQTDAEGFTRGVLFWQRQVGNVTLVSPQRETLANVGGRLNVTPSSQPAQLWLHAGDLSRSRMTQYFNNVGYHRAEQITAGNGYFLHTLTTQLGVPADEAFKVAERLLDARLISPIGGQYELGHPEGQFPTWVSTAQTGAAPPIASTGRPIVDMIRGGEMGAAPGGYLAPPLDWLRGLEATMAIDQGQLSIDAQVLMERQADGQPSAPPPTENKTPRAPTPSPTISKTLESVLKPPPSASKVPPPPEPGK